MFVEKQAHAQVLSNSCGDLFHSAREDRSGYGENIYFCAAKGLAKCYTPEKAMEGLCEISSVPLDGNCCAITFRE